MFYCVPFYWTRFSIAHAQTTHLADQSMAMIGWILQTGRLCRNRWKRCHVVTSLDSLSFSYTCVRCHWMVLYSQLGLRTLRSFTFCGTETVLESILDLMFIYCPSKNASILNLCEYLITFCNCSRKCTTGITKRMNAYIYSIQLHTCWTSLGYW